MEIQSFNENSVNRETAAVSGSEKSPVTTKDESTASLVKPQERTYTKEEINKEITHLNKWLESKSSHLKFVLHDKLNEYYVQIISDNSDEVVREIPSKKVMDAIAVFRENLGLLIDKKI
jgi:flagellar protein FlaG